MSIFSALLTKISNSGKTFQATFLGKTKSDIRSLSPYGFFAVPPQGSKLVMFKDITESFYAVGYKDSSIPSLKEGEATVGNFVKGSIIKFDEDGNINITCNGNKTVTVTGNCTINVTGDASVNAENITAIATTKATVTAPTSEINSTTSCSILSGGTGSVVVTPAGTTIDGKSFLSHVHLAGTPPGNTGTVV
jgi:phage gp45-like